MSSPVVLIRDGNPVIESFRWGLVPFWAKDIKSASKYSLINAKSEEVEQKRSYKSVFENRRCIVPLSGFYEWMKTGTKKRPVAIRMKDHEIMSVAGIWEHWRSKDSSQEVNSFSIMTTTANKTLKDIHERMPVILGRENEQKWLDSENKDTTKLKELLKPCPSEWLDTYEVSDAVNSVKNNGEELLKPVAR